MSKFYQKTYLFWFFAFLLSCNLSFSQVVINEICPTNISINLNSNGKYDDWIELHNSGGSTVNLAGYGISDDTTKLSAFTFPSYTLLPGQKVIVFASDKTNKIIVNHWEMPVNAGTTWKYTTGSASLDTNWRNLSFNDAAWQSGFGGIGFGDNDDNTIIPVTGAVMMPRIRRIVLSPSLIARVVVKLAMTSGSRVKAVL